jgi:hypothetical protein
MLSTSLFPEMIWCSFSSATIMGGSNLPPGALPPGFQRHMEIPVDGDCGSYEAGEVRAQRTASTASACSSHVPPVLEGGLFS